MMRVNFERYLVNRVLNLVLKVQKIKMYNLKSAI